MSAFWSSWIKFLVVLNLGITLFLFLWGQRVKIPTLPDGTTGHVWAHGVLREGVRRLPTWWVLFSAAMFIWGFIYLALYPGFGGSKGLLGWTSQDEWSADTQHNAALVASATLPLRDLSVEEMAAHANATAVGRRLFLDNCAACHGADAKGNQVIGAPDLTDADSLYGSDGTTLLTSILDGRNGTMPGLGGALGHDGVNEAAAYVLSLSGAKAPADWVAAGKARFETVCAACHGVDGRGNPVLGAPNLTDNLWLYGGSFEQVAASIRDGRGGVMPAWRGRLDHDQARAIAAWVYASGPQGHGK